MRKLKRDVVISVVGNKGDLVGVYWADTDGSEVLFECHPNIADLLIDIWNNQKKEKNIKITIQGGRVIDVKGLPENWTYEVEDLD